MSRELQDLTANPVERALQPNQLEASEAFVHQMRDSIIASATLCDEPGLEFCTFKLVDNECRAASWQITDGVPKRIAKLIGDLRVLRAQPGDEIRETRMNRLIEQIHQQEAYMPFWEARLAAAKLAYTVIVRSLDNGEPGNYFAFIGHEWNGDQRQQSGKVRQLTQSDHEAAELMKRYGGKANDDADRAAEHQQRMDEADANRQAAYD